MGRLILTCIVLFFCAGCSAPEMELHSLPKDPKARERGGELVRGLAACGFCHGERPTAESVLSGGRPQYDKYGEVLAPGITFSNGHLGDWSVSEIVRAIRASRGRDEQYLSPEVHRGYEWMSDDDAFAIVAYLGSLAPAAGEVERRDLSFIDRSTTGFFDAWREVRGYVPGISPRYTIAYGEYLTNHVARCQMCHSSPSTVLSAEEYLGGGRVIRTGNGEKTAPAISGSLTEGIGSWSEKDIIHYLTSGKTPEARAVDPDFCPVGFYRDASQQDLAAIAKYLKTVP